MLFDPTVRLVNRTFAAADVLRPLSLPPGPLDRHRAGESRSGTRRCSLLLLVASLGLLDLYFRHALEIFLGGGGAWGSERDACEEGCEGGGVVQEAGEEGGEGASDEGEQREPGPFR